MVKFRLFPLTIRSTSLLTFPLKYSVINWSNERNKLSIVDDQISAPTYSYDLAYFSLLLIEKQKFGLYHISNNGIASKYDQAKYLLEKIGWQGKLLRAKTSDFSLLAKRPHFSKLLTLKLEKVVSEKLPSWQSGLDRYLEEYFSLGGKK